MQIIITAIVAIILLGCLLLAGLGCTHGDDAGAASSGPVIVTVDEISKLDRAAVTAQLRALADAPPPAPTMGAMCYEAAMPPQRAEYVCPVCGEKTLYADDQAQFVERQLAGVRREYQELRAVADEAVALDETEFCRACRPEVERPETVLTIFFTDGTAREVRGVTENDIRLLREFLSGVDAHETFNDATVPLRDAIPRLRYLLGLEPDDEAIG